MKTLKSIFLIVCLVAPAMSFAQSGKNRKSQSDTAQTTYQKKTYKKTTTVGTSSVDTIRKENSPVLEDNGQVNTTGIVDGNRSSTGRPDADTMVNYSVKKSKKTVRSGTQEMSDSTKRKRKQP